MSKVTPVESSQLESFVSRKHRLIRKKSRASFRRCLVTETLETRLALASDITESAWLASEAVNPDVPAINDVNFALQAAEGFKLDTGDISSLEGWDTAAQNDWLSAVQYVNEQLSRLSTDEKLRGQLIEIFEMDGTQGVLQSNSISVDFRNNSELDGIAGAYAAVGHRGQEVIYLNEDWLKSNPGVDQIGRVLLEEAGHALDNRLNLKDSPGDEGRLFAKLVLEGDVSVDSIAAMRQANDHGTRIIDGKLIQVEFATLTTAVFVNAYRITSTVDKETNIHIFDFSNPLGALTVTDGTSNREFSGNDVSVTLQSPNVKDFYGTSVAEIHGWISRPIKVNGRVVGVYLWSDKDFASLALAQQDGNADGDRSTLDNFGYVLVVDQALFNNLSYVSGSSSLKTIGSSSDRVDTALNSLLLPANTAPTAANDAYQAVEAGSALQTNGGNGGVGASASGNVLANDGDVDLASGDTIRVESIGLGGATTLSVAANSTISSGGTTVVGQYGTLTIGADGTFAYVVDDANPEVQKLRLAANTLSESFTYAIVDNAGANATASLIITIVGSNDSPFAFNDSAVAKETEGTTVGVTASGDVLANDTDVDGNLETKVITGLAAEALLGSLTVNNSYTELKFIGQSGFQSVSVGQTLFLSVSGTYRALYASEGSKITVAAKPVEDSTGAYLIDLSGIPAYYIDGTQKSVASLDGATVGFKSTTQDPTTTSSMKVATVSSSLSVASTSVNVDQLIRGVIAKGMVMSGVNVPTGTQVIEVTYNASGVLTSFKVNAALSSTPSNSTATFFAAAGSTLNGRYGSLALASTGSYTYTPYSNNPDLVANDKVLDQFPYTMQDALGATSDAVLSITVLGSSTSDPTANNDANSVQEAGGIRNGTVGSAPTGNLLSNDTTPSGTLVLKSVSSGAAADTNVNQTIGIETSISGLYGELYVKVDGSYRYVLDNSPLVVEMLNSGQTLLDVFNYTTTNGTGIALATLTITIQGANDYPQAVNDVAIANANDGQVVTINSNVLTNDSDIDNLKSALSVVAINGNTSAVGTTLSGVYGTLVLSANGDWSYSLDPNNASVNNLLAGEVLTESFTYRVADPAGGFEEADLDITISGKANTIDINDVFVNEASPFAVFQVSGAVGVEVALALGNTAGSSDVDATLSGTGADIGSQLDIFLNGSWASYTAATFVAIPVSGTLLVRLPVTQDIPYEGNEAFILVATTRDSFAAIGIGTINDEGEGDVFLGNNQSGIPNQAGDTDPNGPDYPDSLDDDRTISVSSTTVNEASPYAFFTVTAYQGQTIELGWFNGGDTPLAGGDGVDYGSNGTDGRVALEYWDTEAVGGPAWTTYTIPVRVPGSAANTLGLLVRTSVVNDQVFEGEEYFRLRAAYVTGGATSSTGLGTITDDFTGDVYLPDGTLDASTTKDDDRSIALDDLTLNEASNYAIFSLTGNSGYSVNLALQNASGGTGKADLRTHLSLPGLEVWDGSQWISYSSATGYTLPSGTVKIRVNIQEEQDNDYEGAEFFQLSGVYRSNTNKNTLGTATIYDDGTGIKQGPGPNDSSSNDLDDDRPSAIARDDMHRSNVGGPVNIQVMNNDSGVNSTLDRNSIDLDPSSPGQQTTFVVAGEGTWTTIPSGIVRFVPLASFNSDPTSISYTVSTRSGQVSNTALISIDYLPIAVSDTVLNATVGSPVEIDVLANDNKGDSTDASSLKFLGGAVGASLTIPGEGVWSIAGGKVVFTPDGSFGGDPKPVRYIVMDNQGNESNAALISVDYQQTLALPFLICIDDGDNASFEVVIVDNTPANTYVSALGRNTTHADSDSAVGRIYYSGSTSNFMSVIVDARSKPLQVGSAPDLSVTARVQSRLQSGSGRLRIDVADHDYAMTNGGSYTLVSPIGGTTHGSVVFTEKVGLSNQLLADGSTVMNAIGPLSSRSYSTSASRSFTATGSSASLAKSFLVVHSTSTRITSFNAGGQLVDLSQLYPEAGLGLHRSQRQGNYVTVKREFESVSRVAERRRVGGQTTWPTPVTHSMDRNQVLGISAKIDQVPKMEEKSEVADAMTLDASEWKQAIDCYYAQFAQNSRPE